MIKEESLPLIGTDEISVPVFRSGLFSWGPEILSPVEIFMDEKSSIITLEEACKQGEDMSNMFFPWIVTGGIGLYSLKKGPAGILTKLDILFRDATLSEMNYDLQNFGEQVVGPEVGKGEDEEYRNNPVFGVFNSDCYYVGPSRIMKGRFATRAFSGSLPNVEGLEEFVGQTDKISLVGNPEEVDPKVVSQGYRLFYADSGKIYHAGFEGIDDYDPKKMNELWGEVELGRNFVNFYPRGVKDDAKDFSAVLLDLPDEFR